MDYNGSDSKFRSEILQDLSIRYGQWHGYISLVVCFFGLPLNVINISVLTRKHLQTPINCILTWLAVSDMLTMVSYVPFAIHFYCSHEFDQMSPEKNSLGWMQFLLFHINFSATAHTVSIWLGVSLAIFRYRHIQSPAKGNLTRMRRLIRARICVCAIYVASIVLLIPNYMCNKLEPHELGNGSVIYALENLNLGTKLVKPVVLLNLFLYSALAKLVPCVLMMVYGGLLVKTLNHKLRIKRRRLSQHGCMTQRPIDTSRTTIMLLIVMVLFLLTELPQGILIILSVILRGFFENVYIPLGDAMDIIALINSGINFVLYCSMSCEFRRTLVKMFSFAIFRNKHKNKRTTLELSKESMQTTWIRLR